MKPDEPGYRHAMRKVRPVTSDVLAALDSWRDIYPQFAVLWQEADPELREAFLHWMSKPHWHVLRRDRVRTAVRESIESGKLQYSKVTLTGIAMADGSLNI